MLCLSFSLVRSEITRIKYPFVFVVHTTSLSEARERGTDSAGIREARARARRSENLKVK